MSVPGDTTRLKSDPVRKPDAGGCDATTRREGEEAGPSGSGFISEDTYNPQPTSMQPRSHAAQQGPQRGHLLESGNKLDPVPTQLRDPPSPIVSILSHPASLSEGEVPDEIAMQQPQPSPFDPVQARGAEEDHIAFFPPFSPSPSPALTPSRWNQPSRSADPYNDPGPAPATTSSRQPEPTSPAIPTAGVAGATFLHNAHHFKIQNLSATVAQTKNLYDHLSPYIAHGAAYNSDERCDAPTCHRETRVAVRGNIVSWIKHGDGSDEAKRIMWLSGPAGCGKTAIAGSVAETCRKQGLLAASFFFSSFSGSVDRYSKRCVVTTIASHLAEHDVLQEYRAQLLLSIERNPAIFHRRLKDQAECLILKPLRSLQEHCDTTSWPQGILIDGLDEVEARQYHDPSRQEMNRKHDNDQLEILDVLFALATDDAFPFRIFVSSRPERIIEEFFSSTAQAYTLRLFLDSQYKPDTDIKLFLRSKFIEIRRRYSISDPSWPGQHALDRIMDMSSGQFIVPATIMRWIEGGIPQQQLREVMELQVESTGSRNPFATLDALYRHILKRAPNPDDDPCRVVKWILTIAPAPQPSPSADQMVPPWAILMNLAEKAATTSSSKRVEPATPVIADPANREPPPARFWRQLLEDVEGELNYRMAPVTSLISVPPPSNSPSPITIHHKSLTDFLSVERRCGDLYVDQVAYNSFLADRIVTVLKDKGPIALRSLPAADLDDFLDHFQGIDLLSPQFTPSRGVVKSFLSFLGEPSNAGAALASCDVAWWASILLRRDTYGRSGIWSLLGIYCTIHAAMGCERNTSIQHETQQAREPKCHAACTHWRTGILAKAKELNWCVHELEKVELDRLGNMTLADVLNSFKYGGNPHNLSSRCGICRPTRSST